MSARHVTNSAIRTKPSCRLSAQDGSRPSHPSPGAAGRAGPSAPAATTASANGRPAGSGDDADQGGTTTDEQIEALAAATETLESLITLMQEPRTSIKNGIRVSAASAFLRPARKRPNLTYLKRTKVRYLLFDRKRIIGVRARDRAGRQDYLSAKDVIVSAGTVESTLLLERSGIGRPEVLKAAGVDVLVESPNLGERVIERRVVKMQVKLKGSIGWTPRLNSVPKEGWEGFKYLLTRRGPISTGGNDLVCAFKSSPDVERPDVQGIWVPLALDATSAQMKLAKHSGFMFAGYKIRPTTQGSVHISARLPENAPLINGRFLETGEDRKVTGKILGRAREVVAKVPSPT